jgi:hypothetical protein
MWSRLDGTVRYRNLFKTAGSNQFREYFQDWHEAAAVAKSKLETYAAEYRSALAEVDAALTKLTEEGVSVPLSHLAFSPKSLAGRSMVTDSVSNGSFFGGGNSSL